MPTEFSNPSYVSPGSTAGGSGTSAITVANQSARLALLQANAAGKLIKQSSDTSLWCLKPGGVVTSSADWEFIGYYTAGSMSSQSAGAVNITGGSISGVTFGAVTWADIPAMRGVLGISNVSNTSDENKPVSIAVGASISAAINVMDTSATNKANAAQAAAILAAGLDATSKASAFYAAAIAESENDASEKVDNVYDSLIGYVAAQAILSQQRSSHTGTQPISTVDGLAGALAALAGGTEGGDLLILDHPAVNQVYGDGQKHRFILSGGNVVTGGSLTFTTTRTGGSVSVTIAVTAGEVAAIWQSRLAAALNADAAWSARYLAHRFINGADIVFDVSKLLVELNDVAFASTLSSGSAVLAYPGRAAMFGVPYVTPGVLTQGDIASRVGQLALFISGGFVRWWKAAEIEPTVWDEEGAGKRDSMRLSHAPSRVGGSYFVDGSWFGKQALGLTFGYMALPDPVDNMGRSFVFSVADNEQISFEYSTVRLKTGGVEYIDTVGVNHGQCLLEATEAGWFCTTGQMINPALLVGVPYGDVYDDTSFPVSTYITNGGPSPAKATMAGLWNYIRGKINGMAIISGPKTFTGQITLTDTQVPVDEYSVMTRGLSDVRYGKRGRIFSHSFLRNFPIQTNSTFSSSGTGSGGISPDGGATMSGSVTASAWQRLALTRMIAGAVDITGGNGYAGSNFAISFMVQLPLQPVANYELLFIHGDSGSGAPPAYGSNKLTAAGFGFSVRWDAGLSKFRVKLFVHNGTTYQESSPVDWPMSNDVSGYAQSIIMSIDGYGLVRLYVPLGGARGMPVTPTASQTGGPSGVYYGGSFTSVLLNNNSTAPSSSSTLRVREILVDYLSGY